MIKFSRVAARIPQHFLDNSREAGDVRADPDYM